MKQESYFYPPNLRLWHVNVGSISTRYHTSNLLLAIFVNSGPANCVFAFRFLVPSDIYTGIAGIWALLEAAIPTINIRFAVVREEEVRLCFLLFIISD